MNTGLFRSTDGKSHAVTFCLVSSLFLLWGFCNGMIDVMDKHFQEELHLTLAQSAWVQFAHYLGYFLMAIPAGYLANKLGYKGGIIAGLLMVAVGGFWFIPATQIATFWAFLVGVCFIASGLTFLETIANPYSTVLGPKQFAATRINLAQSCNGVGWIFGPIVGSRFFYAQNAAGKSTGAETLWIPYVGVAVVVIILAVLFFFANVPDIKADDEFHMDDSAADPAPGKQEVIPNRPVAMGLLWLNIVVLAIAVGMICSAVATIWDPSKELPTFIGTSVILGLIGTAILFTKSKAITHHSVWSHPHFSSATLTQFFYVAAQCGVFAYFINYMTSQIPAMPIEWKNGMDNFASHMGPLQGWFTGWLEVHPNGNLGLSNLGAGNLASLGFFCFLLGRVVGAWLLKQNPAHKILGIFGTASAICSLLIFLKLGWLSAIALFLSYFFMSIMFPTIFSLGIHGLGSRAKKASSFIVMAIMGGAIMPKMMGHIADVKGMSIAFIVPLVCFLVVAGYGFFWSKLSGSDGVVGLESKGGH
ncbi:MFS transporter [Luteolibacter sp. LG18]|uniref:MFS transporter n=1 Tax=Luteolibacter sp. LG18 TaxID=2819286 RepID=UPI002B319A00|nr:hypothetical protein llg_07640 [Luteolibacter sp. LG18]